MENDELSTMFVMNGSSGSSARIFSPYINGVLPNKRCLSLNFPDENFNANFTLYEKNKTQKDWTKLLSN